MITTVTLNPAIDKVVEIRNMSLGKVHRVSRQVVSFGGKSINVARILTGLGSDTDAVCYLGKSNYQKVKELAEAEDLQMKVIMLDGPTRTNVKIVEPDQAYRTTDINEAGFNVSKEEYDQMITLIDAQAESSDYIVMSGSLPVGVGKDFYKEMAIKLKDKTKVIVDADGEVLMSAMEGGPFMIKPNKYELEAAVGRQANTEEEIIDVATELIDRYGITYILVSRGEDGSILVGKDLVLSAGILPVNVLSTVGAGDSMLAGMLYGLTEDDSDLKTALTYGVASSAIAISSQDHKKIDVKTLKNTATKVPVKIL